MKLNDQEKWMLDGDYGAAAKQSLEMLVQLGDKYGADHFVEVMSAHVSISFFDLAILELTENFSRNGGRFSVPTTVNPGHWPGNFNRWPGLGEPSEHLDRGQRMINAIEKLGAIRTYSCVPYFQGYLPRFGQNVAWAETSAIAIANSVIGARVNPLGKGPDKAAAIVGRVPYFGLLLDENRRGNALVRVEYAPNSLADYGTIGHIIGKRLGDKVPVIQGLPGDTTINQLKVLASSASYSGTVMLFHCVGLTPEARTVEQAFGGLKPAIEIKIGPKEIAEAVADMNTARDGHFDAVLLGCPHPHITEVMELASLISGKRVKPGVKFWIFISSDVLTLARQQGYAQLIEEAGAEFVENDCISFFDMKNWGWKTVMTDSSKYANFLPKQPNCLGVIYRDMAGCVAAATAR